MIYRIKPNLDNNELIKYLDTASTLGNLCYSKDSLFVQTDKAYMEVSVMFQGSDVELIEPHYDLSSCSELVKHWCNDIWREDALKAFEDSEKGQSRLNYIMTALNQLDEQNKRGVANANSKTERETAQGKADGSAGREPMATGIQPQ